MGLPWSSFPNLRILGDQVWAYDAVKPRELEDLESDIKIEEWKKEKEKESIVIETVPTMIYDQ